MKLIKSIWQDIREIKSTKKELREFGWVIGIFLGLLAGLLAWKGKPFLVFALVSVFSLGLAFLNPFLLKPFQKIWMALAVTIGWFMSRLILSLVFFLAITPLSLLMRAMGKKFLDMEFRKPGDSYWILKPAEEIPKERYEKQF